MKIQKFTSQNAMDYVREQIPEFEPYWQEHLEYWGDASKTIGIDFYPILDFTTDLIQKQDILILKKIFDVIEEFIVHGDSDINYAASMTFLSMLINHVNHSSTEELDFGIFVPLLGAKSREFCRDLDRFWCSITPGLWDTNETIDDVIHWPNQDIGSLASALRAEFLWGVSIQGYTHLQKCKDSIEVLYRWLKLNETASGGDKAAAENIIHNMQSAINEMNLMNKVMAEYKSLSVFEKVVQRIKNLF